MPPMRTFLTIWIGQVASLIGSGMTAFALGLWIYEQTGEATPFVLIALFNSIPTFALSPIAGALVDRWNRRRVMLAVDSANALVTVALLVLFSSGALQVWHLYLAAFLNSVFSVFQTLAYQTIVTALVPKAQYSRANAMVQTAQSFSAILSPIAAAALYGLVGLSGIFSIDLGSFAIAFVTLLFITIPQPKRDASVKMPTLGADIRAGFNFAKTRRGLIALAFLMALINLLLSSSTVLSAPMILGFATPQVLGWVQSLSSIGLLLGGLLISAWGGPQRKILAIVGSAFLSGLGLAISGLRPDPVLIAIGFFIFMFPITLVNSAIRAIVQVKVPPEMQGRVFSLIFMTARAGVPIGLLLSGPLADRVFEPAMATGGSLAASLGPLLGTGPGRGIGLMLLISGLSISLAALIAYGYPRLRLVENELPDVVE
jgi:DHA3 family macrolide efflux protein-like MFS transporter